MAWVCKICSTNNPDSTDVCFVCDAEREKIKPPVKERKKAQPKRRENAPEATSAKKKREKSTSSTGKSVKETTVSASTATTKKSRSSTRKASSSEAASSTASTRTRGAGMRSTRGGDSSARRRSSLGRTGSSARASSTIARTDREGRARAAEREAKLRESLINARMAIVFTTVFAAVICGLAEQLKTWQVFEWIVGIGVGAVLLFWAICICTNSIGYFKVEPKNWWGAVALGLGLLLNVALFLTVKEKFLVVFVWWSVYAVVGGGITVRWAYRNGYKGIFWTAVAETAAAVALLFLPLIA